MAPSTFRKRPSLGEFDPQVATLALKDAMENERIYDIYFTSMLLNCIDSVTFVNI